MPVFWWFGDLPAVRVRATVGRLFSRYKLPFYPGITRTSLWSRHIPKALSSLAMRQFRASPLRLHAKRCWALSCARIASAWRRPMSACLRGGAVVRRACAARKWPSLRPERHVGDMAGAGATRRAVGAGAGEPGRRAAPVARRARLSVRAGWPARSAACRQRSGPAGRDGQRPCHPWSGLPAGPPVERAGMERRGSPLVRRLARWREPRT